jgi:hypothetical protein
MVLAKNILRYKTVFANSDVTNEIRRFDDVRQRLAEQKDDQGR